LRAVVMPPEDATTRAKVETLRKRLAEVKARFTSGGYREALRVTPSLVSEARTANYEPLIAEALDLMGNILMKSNQAQSAEAAFLESFLAADASRHDEVRAEVADSLVYVVGYQESRFSDARPWAATAESVLRRIGGHELLRSWLLNDLGTVYCVEGDWNASLNALKESLALKQKALGPDHPDVGVSEGNLAITLAELGRKEEALTHSQRSVALMERGLGAAHPELAIQLYNLGEVLNSLGRYSKAREIFERARTIWDRELGPESRSVAHALTGIGLSYLAEKTPTAALDVLEVAYKIRIAQESDPSKRAETSFALARTLWELGRDRGRARILAEQARSSYSKAERKAKLDEVEVWLRGHGSS
jgi:tetratricopeptide (TPR) repeat protein